jgi:hypothetical protein
MEYRGILCISTRENERMGERHARPPDRLRRAVLYERLVQLIPDAILDS